ncbi:hypothetical protein Vretimale_130 [Volvox reticuliferus]|uniref:Uncharacterized protein n=1 Tax=Volvox reticuliferus TaxID=1737510 RepID=A0A8J4D2C8_9CHLO|nr:hypothetical protein Vretifemale_8270 [Volvox reticuliferus]GIL93903.1 hypothetical protein Vretimale_130 [Volvox reticuliferus]
MAIMKNCRGSLPSEVGCVRFAMLACLMLTCNSASLRGLMRAKFKGLRMDLPAASPVGSHAINIHYAEGNLCTKRRNTCGTGSRVDVLVDADDDGNQVWAPVCAATKLNDTLQDTLAHIVCNQNQGWPDTDTSEEVGGMSVTGVAELPYIIPEAPEESDFLWVFDSSNVTHWVTVTGWSKKPPRRVRAIQELPLKVSTKPCKSGLLFSVKCYQAQV